MSAEELLAELPADEFAFLTEEAARQKVSIEVLTLQLLSYAIANQRAIQEATTS
jgi:hypothetical protein